jgi:hypothetical protein
MNRNLTEELIRRKLASYWTGETTLRAFNRWFAPATSNVNQRAPARLKELVYGIKLRLAEYSNAHWTEADLRMKLLPLITSVSASMVLLRRDQERTEQIQTGSADRTITFHPFSNVRAVPEWQGSYGQCEEASA